MKITKSNHARVIGLEKKLRQIIFFPMLIVSFLEAFMEIALYMILTIKQGETEPFAEALSYELAWFCFSVIVIFLPVNLIRLVMKEEKFLGEQNEFTRKYGELFNGIRVKTIP